MKFSLTISNRRQKNLISNKNNTHGLDPTEFYKHTVVFNGIKEDSLGIRISALLDQVIQDLPNEEQFKMSKPSGGVICLNTREQAIKFWNGPNGPGSILGYNPGFERLTVDGHSVLVNTDDGIHLFTIIIIVDNFDSRTDGYIKGVIAHEFSEMSYSYRIWKENSDKLKKMKPKARQVMLNKLAKSTSNAGSKEHEEYEDMVNNEARRLGFKNEIAEMLKNEFVEPLT